MRSSPLVGSILVGLATWTCGGSGGYGGSGNNFDRTRASPYERRHDHRHRWRPGCAVALAEQVRWRTATLRGALLLTLA